MITLMLLLSLFMLIPQLALSATAEAEILIFSLSTEKVKEQKGVLKIQISTFSPIQKATVDGKPQKFPKAAYSKIINKWKIFIFLLGNNEKDYIRFTNLMF